MLHIVFLRITKSQNWGHNLGGQVQNKNTEPLVEEYITNGTKKIRCFISSLDFHGVFHLLFNV